MKDEDIKITKGNQYQRTAITIFTHESEVGDLEKFIHECIDNKEQINDVLDLIEKWSLETE